ncbi:NTE family protein [Priestia taiwanensis]|uniref:Esterase n=1 Tax=Priestia taiwanensis TaxID=1347902 RepID=A0A917AQ79_9BACI|nr:patatin-like phospholipase family protein [Priestia taiwanensis]MBM7362951.1 NTE family protein [Priestia taiwanensis]GGE66408.1 esterase [Priestia taiwanensis]
MRPKIGLALGSGSARGFAHAGVLKVLKEENIPIDMIAGSSIGALAGTLYGAGSDVERLYRLAQLFKRKYYTDFIVPKMGLIAGNRIKEFMKLMTFGKTLEELDIPVAVVATDLSTGEKVIFTEGEIASAVRASISIPGIFVPEKIGDRLFVDGGLVERVPVSVARGLGADIVIGVDVSVIKRNQPIVSIYDVIMQSIDIMQNEGFRQHEIACDCMIRPKVNQFNARTFTQLDEIIEAGEVAAREHIEEIKALIANWKESK